MLACIWTVVLTTTQGDEAVLLPLLHALCSLPHHGSPWWPRKAMEKVSSRTRSAPGGFLAAPSSPLLFAIGYFLRRQTGNLISRAPAPRPPPPLRRDRFGTGSTGGICAAASRFQLVVLREVAVLIAGGISPLDLVASPRRRELVTYPLVGGAKAPWGGLGAAAAGLQARQIAFPSRHYTPPSPSPRSRQDAPPPPRPAPLSRGISVWLLCSGAF